MNFHLFNSLRDPRLVNPRPYRDLREDDSFEAKLPEKIRLANHAFNAAKVRKDEYMADKERRAEERFPTNVSLLRKQGN